MPKDLTNLVQRAANTIAGRSNAPTIVVEPQPAPELPLGVLISNPLPAPTDWEQAMDRVLAKPRGKLGVDPRKPWIGKGTMELVPVPELPNWEQAKAQEALRIATTRAKLGQRLTFAQRKLLANHGLQRAMVKFRKPQGE